MELLDPMIRFFTDLDLDWPDLLKAGGVLLLGCLLIGLLGRFVFGKKSTLNSAVSSAIAIIFICAVSVVLCSLGVASKWIAPLPFVRMQTDALLLFDFFSADFHSICSEMLGMIILAFLINLIDGWLPKSKNIFVWLLLRFLSVVLSYGLHLLVSWLFANFLPGWIVTYAPVALLLLLLLTLLTGALKIIVGAFMATVNPVIAALYTFFFASIVGKQISKAVLTSALLAGFVILLRYLGVASLSILSSALMAYIPFLLVLILLWYLINRLF